MKPRPARALTSRLWPGAAAFALCAPAIAQTPPSAGTLLQELRPAPLAVPKADAPVLEVQPAPRKPMAGNNGVRVTVRRLHITGSTVFTEAQLLPLVQDATGQSLGLDGLEELAERITAHYHAQGYPVARAYLPAQDVQDGTVEIAVIEGRYGAITVRGADEATRARLPLGALRVGDVVADGPLEQTLLLLERMPGVSVKASLQPGEAVGTSELVIDVDTQSRMTGALEADNHGSRATGRARVGGSVVFANLGGLGDELTLRGLTSGKGLAFGRVGWQVPMGGAGATVGVAASHLLYELGGNFAALDASGTADTLTLSAALPLLRSRAANLGLQATLDEKQLKDSVGSAGTAARKRATVLAIGLAGDRSDTLGAGGFTSFSLAYSLGRLRLEGEALATDAATARTDGSFGKLSLAVQRVQSLGAQTSLFASLTAQWASKNLDSSEKLALGGPSAVRAYASGESPSDRAQLATLELRHAVDANWQWLGFFDIGHGTVNQQRWAAATGPASRTLRGAGVGLNWAGPSGWSARLVYAHRLGHEPATATADGDRSGRLWLSAAKAF